MSDELTVYRDPREVGDSDVGPSKPVVLSFPDATTQEARYHGQLPEEGTTILYEGEAYRVLRIATDSDGPFVMLLEPESQAASHTRTRL